MKWLRVQVAVLAIMLAAAVCQCALACTVEPCHATSAPPCHHHQPSRQGKAPTTCANASLLAEYRAPVVVFTHLLCGMLPAQSAVAANLIAPQREVPRDLSPPVRPDFLHSTVLKI
jgi:hypothetical protein